MFGASRTVTASSLRRLDLHPDIPPLLLPEPEDRERTAGHMTHDDREPDAGRCEAPHGLKRRADPDRHQYLRYQRDIEGAPGVAGALEPPSVGERYGDEEP